ncbi:hypothetical protein BKA70DRAFT_1247191 [Coprinopsis sp. MPI-PUGE-AT-0042]|nr:hypothetical protein BKA70DRAFT_1247191 [Coprinopsis sp. MPI-PUGE-AT-0042]
MPVPTTTPLRDRRQASPPLSTATPMRTPSRSAYSAYTPTVTSGTGATKMNVVTRVALEGRAKHGQDGASIKMYLKLSIPLDSVTPGTTIALFPEENVKILSSQVHPLDNTSVPYNFSSTISPLLHKASKALSLPARSSQTFNATFGIATESPPATSSSRVSKADSNPEVLAPVDEYYSGHILVSGYHISYVLPKSFPGHNDYDDGGYSRPSSSRHSRRMSIGERNTAQFMAAVDMWVPYVSRPPRSPYLLSIPIPRCLHNQIRLRIFPPNPPSNSYASLSSIDDEGGSWDLTADPPVARGASASKRIGRSSSYGSFADDESSDSSTAGFPDGCGIHGTFPSAERIRIRWAKPTKTLQLPEGSRDGRRRVGVKSVKGEMTCIVRGRGRPVDPSRPEGILMDVEYKTTCSGIWFPGVATMLGMDVGLEAKGSEISWAQVKDSGKWKIAGETGFTGFDVGPSTTTPKHESRASSLDSSTSSIPNINEPNGFLGTNLDPAAGASNTSLLRAPLPSPSLAEYSFEGSSSSLGSNGSMSSVPSLSASGAQVANVPSSPSQPITIHLDINDLLPPSKNVFTFSIKGTIVVTPKVPLSRLNSSANELTSGTDEEWITDPIMLPKFTVLAADSEATTTILRNDIEAPNSVVEVYRPNGDIFKDAHAKKTVLRRGGSTKCGEEGYRIVVKFHDMFKQMNGSAIHIPSGVSKQPLTQRQLKASSTASSQELPDVPASIPKASLSVSFLAKGASWPPNSYTVSLRLPVPVSKDLDWLEFGFPMPPSNADSKGISHSKPRFSVTSATVEGIPVQVETSNAVKGEPQNQLESVAGKQWLAWVKLDVSTSKGGHLTFDYFVETGDESGKMLKDGCNVLLPTFTIPVSKLEVFFAAASDSRLSTLSTNLDYRIAGSDVKQFAHHDLAEFFSPQLVVKSSAADWTSRTYFAITWALILLAFVGAARHSRMSPLVSRYEPLPGPPISIPIISETSTTVVTTTVTSTVTSTVLVSSTLYNRAIEQTPIATFKPPPPPSPTSARVEVPSPQYAPPPEEVSPPPTTPQAEPYSTPLLEDDPWDDSEEPERPSLLQSGLSVLQSKWNTLWKPSEFEFYEQASSGLHVLWGYVRKAWHFPLDPP